MRQNETTTKRRIVKEALNLFAQKGYSAVSVAEIAAETGIKAPSLYKHFKSKQEIFDHILLEAKASFEKMAASQMLDGVSAKNDEDLFKTLSSDKIAELCINIFQYYLHDETTSKVRRMLTIEQFHNRAIADEYISRYMDFPLAYQTQLFDLMIKAGVSVGPDPAVMALQYYAPVHFYITLCDTQPQREAEALKALNAHFKRFMEHYSTH